MTGCALADTGIGRQRVAQRKVQRQTPITLREPTACRGSTGLPWSGREEGGNTLEGFRQPSPTVRSQMLNQSKRRSSLLSRQKFYVRPEACQLYIIRQHLRHYYVACWRRYLSKSNFRHFNHVEGRPGGASVQQHKPVRLLLRLDVSNSAKL